MLLQEGEGGSAAAGCRKAKEDGGDSSDGPSPGQAPVQQPLKAGLEPHLQSV